MFKHIMPARVFLSLFRWNFRFDTIPTRKEKLGSAWIGATKEEKSLELRNYFNQ
ncbi:hypothetical protein LguiA_036033 [Lonicera macranthoides]